MPKKQKINKNYWFHLGLLGVLLSAPNATVIKYSMSSIDPYLFNALRFLAVALLTTPLLLANIGSFNKINFKYSVKAGLCMTIAVITYVWAIKLSQASYVSIITLLTPIAFIILSARLTGEKITSRSVAGIGLAALGALVIVVLPVAIKQNGTFTFNPLATTFALINVIVFPLAMINYKKANEAGVSMVPLISVTSWIICLFNAVLFLVLGSAAGYHINNSAFFGILYSGIVIAFIARIMNITSYEHIGAAVTGALEYLEIFLAILLPVAVLHEKLSPEMIIGGILILCGVYVVEYHKSVHHKHHHIFRSH